MSSTTAHVPYEFQPVRVYLYTYSNVFLNGFENSNGKEHALDEHGLHMQNPHRDIFK